MDAPSHSPEPAPDARALKRLARAGLRGTAGGMGAAERGAASVRVCARLVGDAAFDGVRTVLLYAATPGEVDLGALVWACRVLGVGVCLNRIDAGNSRLIPAAFPAGLALEAGPFGVLQPPAGAAEVPLDRIDLVVAPGLGFDRAGGRLGRGGGFYDRLIAQFRAQGGGRGAVICGVSFAEGVLPAGEFVPAEAHDRPVDVIVTEEEVIRIRKE